MIGPPTKGFVCAETEGFGHAPPWAMAKYLRLAEGIRRGQPVRDTAGDGASFRGALIGRLDSSSLETRVMVLAAQLDGAAFVVRYRRARGYARRRAAHYAARHPARAWRADANRRSPHGDPPCAEGRARRGAGSFYCADGGHRGAFGPRTYLRPPRCPMRAAQANGHMALGARANSKRGVSVEPSPVEQAGVKWLAEDLEGSPAPGRTDPAAVCGPGRPSTPSGI